MVYSNTAVYGENDYGNKIWSHVYFHLFEALDAFEVQF